MHQLSERERKVLVSIRDAPRDAFYLYQGSKAQFEAWLHHLKRVDIQLITPRQVINGCLRGTLREIVEWPELGFVELKGPDLYKFFSEMQAYKARLPLIEAEKARRANA